MATRKSTTPAESGLSITVESGFCGCGCGAALKPAPQFVQGHDAKLHSALAAALKRGEAEFELNGSKVSIEARYAQSGWKMPVAKAEPEADAS